MIAPVAWRLAHGRTLTLDRPRLIAIMNLTPDSFSDGGALASVEAAVERAAQALAEGADMLDLGGESTRPGAAPVGAPDQIARVIPALRAIRRAGIGAPISIDTTRAEVARAALDEGADAINDQSAGDDDPAMLPLVASRACAVILMHRARRPAEDRYSTDPARALEDLSGYPPERGGVVGAVRMFHEEHTSRFVRAGVDPGAIVIDPGLGFGKSVAQNFELIRRTPELLELGFPVLSAASRKSFVGQASCEPEPARRVEGSIAVSVAHWLLGARLFRVHDVAAHRRALGAAWAIAPGAPKAPETGGE